MKALVTRHASVCEGMFLCAWLIACNYSTHFEHSPACFFKLRRHIIRVTSNTYARRHLRDRIFRIDNLNWVKWNRLS